MNSLQELNYLELLFSDNFNEYEATEIINLPGFTIIASNVIEDTRDVTSFLVKKVFGWNGSHSECSACLFDYLDEPTLGLWYDDTLVLYQNKDARYIRFIYFIANSQSNIYHNLVDISSDGQQWQRYSQGCYQWT